MAFAPFDVQTHIKPVLPTAQETRGQPAELSINIQTEGLGKNLNKLKIKLHNKSPRGFAGLGSYYCSTTFCATRGHGSILLVH